MFEDFLCSLCQLQTKLQILQALRKKLQRQLSINIQNTEAEMKGHTEGEKGHCVVKALSLRTADSNWCLVPIKVGGFGQKHLLSLQRLVLPLSVLNDLRLLRHNSR